MRGRRPITYKLTISEPGLADQVTTRSGAAAVGVFLGWHSQKAKTILSTIKDHPITIPVKGAAGDASITIERMQCK